jgi:transcriptional regulator with XRE-family HTH domain
MASARTDWTNSSLGERIDHICSLRGLSLNRLGEAAGIASGPMSRLSRREENMAGSPDTLTRIADAGGVNVAWLLAGRGPVERERRGSLRAHVDWPTALADAKKRQRGIPEEFWEMVGDYPAPKRIDWQLIVGLVRELFSAHQRFEEDEPERAAGDAEQRPLSPRRSAKR